MSVMSVNHACRLEKAYSRYIACSFFCERNIYFSHRLLVLRHTYLHWLDVIILMETFYALVYVPKML